MKVYSEAEPPLGQARAAALGPCGRALLPHPQSRRLARERGRGGKVEDDGGATCLI
jgi:hypothetical protein